VLTPLETTTLIVAFGLVVQGLSVWRLRRALRFDRLWPFLAGGAIGVPIGAELLRWANPEQIRGGVGALLILFSLYSWFRPKLALPTAGGRAADGSVGFSLACSAGRRAWAGFSRPSGAACGPGRDSPDRLVQPAGLAKG
jgi:uncharacterized protein